MRALPSAHPPFEDAASAAHVPDRLHGSEGAPHPEASSNPQATSRLPISSVVARFSVINGIVMALGIITGPLQARALGPAGRGDLAAITVVASMLPLIAGFGLYTYAGRQVAQHRPVGDVMGSVGLVLVLAGLIIAPLGFPIAALLAHGRGVVYAFVLASFLLLPICLLNPLSFFILNSLEEWGKTIVFRTFHTVAVAVCVVVLFTLHRATVFSLALVTIVATTIMSIVGGIWVLRRGRPRIRTALIKEGIPFGLRSWPGSLAALTNVRLDQFLMISVTSSSQLGLYAVAVTAASLPNVLTSALIQPIMSRVGAGEHYLVSRSLRTTVLLITLTNFAVAASVPFLLPLAFGQAFGGAVPMALILLLAALPLAIATVLGSALTIAGRPGTATLGQVAALAITLPGLLLLLPRMGGTGAALVSLAAYTTNAGYQLWVARSIFNAPLTDFIIPHRDDYLWVRRRLFLLATKRASWSFG
jgi:O-antigen/teichoic acid export membrane protein